MQGVCFVAGLLSTPLLSNNAISSNPKMFLIYTASFDVNSLLISEKWINPAVSNPDLWNYESRDNYIPLKISSNA